RPSLWSYDGQPLDGAVKARSPMRTVQKAENASGHGELPPPLRQAVALHRSGDLAGALACYGRFVEQNPQHPTALQLLGLLHSQRGEYEQAISYMRESLRLFPQQAEVANNLGNAFSRSGKADEAAESYSAATRIYPRYLDAWRNLGLCQLERHRIGEAVTCFQRCLELRPDDAAAWLGLGNAHKRQNDLDAAISCFEKALALRPDYAEAHHNLGVCLRIRQRPVEALDHYAAAGGAGLDGAALHHNRGNALADTGDARAAIKAWRTALERNPLDLDSHRNLNSLMWQQELLDDYLASYQQALRRHPQAVPLRLAYAMALNQQERFAEAERVLREGLRHPAESSELKSLLAYTLENEGRRDEALKLHAAAVAMPGATPDHRISYARALLASGRPDEALVQARLGAVQTPFNQRALAYLALCWRLLGDPRDAVLNDYRSLVRTYDVPVPRGYSSSGEFNERLSRVLRALHSGKRHPPEQTVRGGTQTSGSLFDRREPEIQQLVAGLKLCIDDYIAALPPHGDHPLLARRSAAFSFAGSWSVRLARRGYHTMHVHPFGWISSAYYVEVPPAVTDGTAGGGLKFGEPDIDVGAEGAARRLVRPEVGRLVLFPSYMWHGTVPFETGESRLSVAFDVVPVANDGLAPPPPAG
ncbi:MAG: tetratricopeptide repeat protein, partial [Woeseia sp.]